MVFLFKVLIGFLGGVLLSFYLNAKLNFKIGDVITSTIETTNGETIIVTHDCSSPRPYSLGFRVQGTEGLWEVDGNRIYIEGKSKNPHEWDEATEWLEKYDHPLWQKYGELATGAGHGGMDFIMDWRLIDCLRNGLPLDQNV